MGAAGGDSSPINPAGAPAAIFEALTLDMLFNWKSQKDSEKPKLVCVSTSNDITTSLIYRINFLQ